MHVQATLVFSLEVSDAPNDGLATILKRLQQGGSGTVSLPHMAFDYAIDMEAIPGIEMARVEAVIVEADNASVGKILPCSAGRADKTEQGKADVREHRMQD